jgi:hypothetical protein
LQQHRKKHLCDAYYCDVPKTAKGKIKGGDHCGPIVLKTLTRLAGQEIDYETIDLALKRMEKNEKKMAKSQNREEHVVREGTNKSRITPSAIFQTTSELGAFTIERMYCEPTSSQQHPQMTSDYLMEVRSGSKPDKWGLHDPNVIGAIAYGLSKMGYMEDYFQKGQEPPPEASHFIFLDFRRDVLQCSYIAGVCGPTYGTLSLEALPSVFKIDELSLVKRSERGNGKRRAGDGDEEGAVVATPSGTNLEAQQLPSPPKRRRTRTAPSSPPMLPPAFDGFGTPPMDVVAPRLMIIQPNPPAVCCGCSTINGGYPKKQNCLFFSSCCCCCCCSCGRGCSSSARPASR